MPVLCVLPYCPNVEQIKVPIRYISFYRNVLNAGIRLILSSTSRCQIAKAFFVGSQQASFGSAVLFIFCSGAIPLARCTMIAFMM